MSARALAIAADMAATGAPVYVSIHPDTVAQYEGVMADMRALRPDREEGPNVSVAACYVAPGTFEYFKFHFGCVDFTVFSPTIPHVAPPPDPPATDDEVPVEF